MFSYKETHRHAHKTGRLKWSKKIITVNMYIMMKYKPRDVKEAGRQSCQDEGISCIKRRNKRQDRGKTLTPTYFLVKVSSRHFRSSMFEKLMGKKYSICTFPDFIWFYVFVVLVTLSK